MGRAGIEPATPGFSVQKYDSRYNKQKLMENEKNLQNKAQTTILFYIIGDHLSIAKQKILAQTEIFSVW